jgi:hypothetical protein
MLVLVFGNVRHALAILCLVLSAEAVAQFARPNVTATPSADAFSLHEPIFINLAFRVVESEAEGLPRPPQLRLAYFVESEPAGKRPPTGLPQATDQGFPIFVRYAVDGEAHYSLLLNKWFEFDEPGRYEVTIEFYQPADVKVSTIVTVTARDEERLEAACRQLGDAASVASPRRGVASSILPDAGEALMYLRDEALIPCLLDQAARGILAPAMALREMDSIAAVRALQQLTQSPLPTIAAEARRRLSELESRTSKNDVREEASSALR